MSDTTNLSIRIDRSLKEDADRVFNALGMSMTTAITVFIRQAVRQRRIPFEVALDPPGGTVMQEAAAATERIWLASAANGTDRMTMEEIDAEIKAAREERKAAGATA